MKKLTKGTLIEMNLTKGQFIYATGEWFKNNKAVLKQATNHNKDNEIEYTIIYLGVYDGIGFETENGFQVFENDKIYLIVEKRYYLSDYIQAFDTNDLNHKQWILDEDGYYFTYDEEEALFFEELQNAFDTITVIITGSLIMDYAESLRNGGASL